MAALFLIPGSTPRMDTRRYPNGLAVLEQVPVNGSQQWILIRSESTANPVVLFVHGGPGTSWLTLMRKNTQPLEKYFTVVNWDQRRAGKSFAAGGVEGGNRQRDVGRACSDEPPSTPGHPVLGRRRRSVSDSRALLRWHLHVKRRGVYCGRRCAGVRRRSRHGRPRDASGVGASHSHQWFDRTATRAIVGLRPGEKGPPTHSRATTSRCSPAR